MFSGPVTVNGTGSTTAREMSLRFLNRSFVFLVSPSCTAVIFCDSLLWLHSTLQGSVSMVVPDQMHWRGDADFPKVTKLLGSNGTFILNSNLLGSRFLIPTFPGRGRRWFPIPDMFRSFGKRSLKIATLKSRRSSLSNQPPRMTCWYLHFSGGANDDGGNPWLKRWPESLANFEEENS